MPGAISYYDWMIPENQQVGVIPASVGISDSSTGGTAFGSLDNLSQEDLSTTYGRTGIDRSGPEVFQLDITTNTTTLGETQATYGAIAALAVKVSNSSGTYVDAKVTITVDPNSGSFGAGAVFSGVVYLAAADAIGQSTYPNRNALVFPFADQLTDAGKRQGGMGGSQRNKIRIKIEPRAGTGGSTGVVIYGVELSRVMVSRCLFAKVRNTGLIYQAEGQSIVQRSYSGVPFVSRKPIVRSVSGQFAGMVRAQVFGTDGTTEYPASMQAVNGFSGISRNVIFAPRLEPPTYEQSSGEFLKAWSNEHIYGLMDRALVAALSTTTNNADREYWECSFSITETPQP